MAPRKQTPTVKKGKAAAKKPPQKSKDPPKQKADLEKRTASKQRAAPKQTTASKPRAASKPRPSQNRTTPPMTRSLSRIQSIPEPEEVGEDSEEEVDLNKTLPYFGEEQSEFNVSNETQIMKEEDSMETDEPEEPDEVMEAEKGKVNEKSMIRGKPVLALQDDVESIEHNHEFPPGNTRNAQDEKELMEKNVENPEDVQIFGKIKTSAADKKDEVTAVTEQNNIQIIEENIVRRMVRRIKKEPSTLRLYEQEITIGDSDGEDEAVGVVGQEKKKKEDEERGIEEKGAEVKEEDVPESDTDSNDSLDLPEEVSSFPSNPLIYAQIFIFFGEKVPRSCFKNFFLGFDNFRFEISKKLLQIVYFQPRRTPMKVTYRGISYLIPPLFRPNSMTGALLNDKTIELFLNKFMVHEMYDTEK